MQHEDVHESRIEPNIQMHALPRPASPCRSRRHPCKHSAASRAQSEVKQESDSSRPKVRTSPPLLHAQLLKMSRSYNVYSFATICPVDCLSPSIVPYLQRPAAVAAAAKVKVEVDTDSDDEAVSKKVRLKLLSQPSLASTTLTGFTVIIASSAGGGLCVPHTKPLCPGWSLITSDL